LIVGAVWGADQDNLSNRIKKINDLSPNSVRWINERIPDEHVQYFFQESIVVVLPYLEIYSSGVLLRALGYGKPVIVSNLPAFLEVVDSNNSFIFKSGSSFSLENVIRESLLNPRLREQKKVSAKKLVENQLSWNATGTKMSELINSIIAK
jgi:glycosyltransferase involved in cell wall biosynthesis